MSFPTESLVQFDPRSTKPPQPGMDGEGLTLEIPIIIAVSFLMRSKFFDGT
jgi:hypothetical protein